MSFAVILVIAAMLPVTAFSGIYKYLDENGNVAYSDKPVDGAKKLHIRVHDPSAEEDDIETSEDGEFNEDDEVIEYQALEMLNPTPGKVVSDRSGSVQVILLPQPRLSPRHKLIITVDGKDISRGQHTNINLTNVARGPHTVSARIIDEFGALMIESGSVSFTVSSTFLDG